MFVRGQSAGLVRMAFRCLQKAVVDFGRVLDDVSEAHDFLDCLEVPNANDDNGNELRLVDRLRILHQWYENGGI